MEAGQADPLRDESKAVEALEARLRAAIRLQSIADVPLGAFLSGGVDSSTIVALMQSEAVSPLRTFTTGFEDAAHDEAVHARAPERRDWLAARSGLGVSLAGDKVHKLAQGLAGARDLDGLYQSLVGEWRQPRELVRGATEAPTLLKRPEE